VFEEPAFPRAIEPARREKNLKILFLAVGFFFAFGATNVCYLLPVYYGRLGYDARASAWLVASFYISSVLFRLVLVNLLPRLGLRRAFWLATVFSIFGSIFVACGGARFSLALLGRILFGFGCSLYQIGLATYQAVAFRTEERGGAFSLIMAGGLAPMMTLVPLADWLLQHAHERSYIALPLVLSILTAVVALRIPGLSEVRMSPPAQNGWNPLAGVGECLKLRGFRLALYSMALFSAVDAASAFMSTMTAARGMLASFFLSSNAAVGVLVRLFFGKLLDRFPRRKLAAPVMLWMAGLLLAASFVGRERHLVLLGLCFGVGMGFGFPLNLAYVSDAAPRSLQAQAVSMSWFLMGTHFAVIPLLTGWISASTGPVPAFRIVTGGVFLLSGLLLFLTWGRKGETPDPG
jgi:Arabinose efflux permease